MSEDTNYDRVTKAFKPEVGGNPSATDASDFDQGSSTYADLDFLQDYLLRLISETRAFISLLERGLVERALPVDQSDDKLIEANRVEWPSELGDPRDRVSYRFYKALRTRGTTSSSYIRKRYEDAARDVAGSNAIDFLALANLILDEALLIQEFLNAYIGTVDDSSEYRSIELFQDWVVPTLELTRQLWSFFEEGDSSAFLTPAEMGYTTAEEARQAQAVFKIKLNAANDEIVRDLEYLQKNFAEFAPIFYTKFLGPALDFRLNVARNVFPSDGGISAEVDRAATTLNASLRMVLADQMRRNMLFSRTTQKLVEQIQERDRFRIHIHQLAPLGRPVPTTGRSVLIQSADTSEEVQAFEVDRIFEHATPNFFLAAHGELSGLEVDNAHPQYLLRTGGTMLGDLLLAPEVKVDNIRPSTHAHTGIDGSTKISGKDIVGGSVSSDVVDPADKPPVPTNLRILSMVPRVIPPGVTSVETQLAWDGSTEYTYEVQITRVDS